MESTSLSQPALVEKTTHGKLSHCIQATGRIELSIEELKSILEAMPLAQQIFVAMFFVISTLGGNYVFIRHNKRSNQSPGKIWLVYKNLLEFDRTDWILLLIVCAASALCIALALMAG